MNRAALERAFRATAYCVDTGRAIFALRLDVPHSEFGRWLVTHCVSHWAVVTACNPGAEPAPHGNAPRTMALGKAVEARGWRCLPACNQADAGDWPDEPGYCLLDVGDTAVALLAREFGQTAWVCGGGDGAGRLVWSDDRL